MSAMPEFNVIYDRETQFRRDQIRRELRDQFAMHAMMGAFVLGRATGNSFDAIAADAYLQADAMMKAREA